MVHECRQMSDKPKRYKIKAQYKKQTRQKTKNKTKQNKKKQKKEGRAAQTTQSVIHLNKNNNNKEIYICIFTHLHK